MDKGCVSFRISLLGGNFEVSLVEGWFEAVYHISLVVVHRRTHIFTHHTYIFSCSKFKGPPEASARSQAGGKARPFYLCEACDGEEPTPGWTVETPSCLCAPKFTSGVHDMYLLRARLISGPGCETVERTGTLGADAQGMRYVSTLSS